MTAFGTPLVWCLLAAHLLFALAPHHHHARHTHADDGHGHTHAVSTLHQAKLERQFLVALAPASQQANPDLIEKLSSTAEPNSATNSSSNSAPATPDEALLADSELKGSPGLKPQTPSSHDHFFSDPNVESTPSELTFTHDFCGRISELPQDLTRKAEAIAFSAWARGPPQG